MKPLIIIPTLNEIDHIADVLQAILKQNLFADILIIDAQSTDGTADVVSVLQKKHPQISMITQTERGNYGGALKMGFKYALQHDYDPVITMDGDGAHDPMYIGQMLNNSAHSDVIIGSRYIDGVRIDGWRFRNLLISKLANMYISYVLLKPIWDFTSGFRCYRAAFLRAIGIDELPSYAYMFQIEMLHLAYKNRFRVKEIPANYRGKKNAESKVSGHSRLKTMLYVLKFRAPFLEILRHLAYVKKDYERFVDEYEELLNPPQLKKNGQFSNTKPYSVSIGVMAYNEEKIIARCLQALQKQKLRDGRIDEIIVVSSASTDNTDGIVRGMVDDDKRLVLITQPVRKGKASAINAFLEMASGDIAIIESADTITEPDTVQKLLEPFSDPKIGMTGVHPRPVNSRKSFVGYCVNRLWELHHLMALDRPKCGEMIAFRNIVTRIPRYTAVDEASIEAILCEAGLELAYASEAYVHNKGPETIADFIKQRRRIAAGHRHLKVTMGHRVPTSKAASVLKYVFKSQRWRPKEMIYMFLLICIEGMARILGFFDFYLRDKNPFIWDMSLTTKKM